MPKTWFKDKSDGQVFWTTPETENQYLDAVDASGNYVYDTNVSDEEIAEYERQEAQENALQEKETRLGAEKATAPVVGKGISEPAKPKEQPEYTPEEYEAMDKFGIGGVSGGLMAAAEGFVDGAFWNLPVGVLSGIDPDYAKRAALRKKMFGDAQNTAEWAGILLPTAGTLLKGSVRAMKAAPTLITKAAEADIGANLLSVFTKRGRLAGKALEEVSELTVNPATKARYELIKKEYGEAAAKAYGEMLEQNAFQKVMETKFARLKPTEKALEALKVGAGTFGRAAIEGASRAAGTELREQTEINPNLAGTELVSQAVNSALEGGVVAGTLASGLHMSSPLLAKTASKAIEGTNNAAQWLLGKTEQFLGSKITDLRPQDIAKAQAAMRKAVKLGAEATTTDLGRQLDTELQRTLDNATYFDIARTNEPLRNKLEPRIVNKLDQLSNDFKVAEADLAKSKYVIKGDKGEHILNSKAILDDLKIEPVLDAAGNPTVDAAGKPVIKIKFPDPIEKLRAMGQKYNDILDISEKFATEELTKIDPLKLGLTPQSAAQIQALKGALITRALQEAELRSGKTAEQVASELGNIQDAQRIVDNFMEPLKSGRTADVGFGAGVVAPLAGILEAGGAMALNAPKEFSLAGLGLTGASILGTMATDPVAVLRAMNILDRASTSRAAKLAEFSNRVLYGTGTEAVTKLAVKGQPSISREENVEDRRKAYEATKQNLLRFNNQDELTNLLASNYDALRDTSPSLADQSAVTTTKAIRFLQDKLPKQNGQTMQLKGWKPDITQIDKFNRYTRYVTNPDNILVDIEKKGYVPVEAMEVMQQVYPEWHQELKTSMLDALSKSEGKTIDSKKRFVIDTLFGNKPMGLSAADIQKNQAAMQVGGNKSGKVGTPNTEATPSQELTAP